MPIPDVHPARQLERALPDVARKSLESILKVGFNDSRKTLSCVLPTKPDFLNVFCSYNRIHSGAGAIRRSPAPALNRQHEQDFLFAWHRQIVLHLGIMALFHVGEKVPSGRNEYHS